MTTRSSWRRTDDVCPGFIAINEQPIRDKALFAMLRRRDFNGTKLAVAIGKILQAYILIISFLVRAEGEVKHAQWASAELVYRGADGPFAVLGRWK